MSRRNSRSCSHFTPAEEEHIARVFQWDLAIKRHTYCHAQACLTNEQNKQAHTEGNRLLQWTEPYKIWGSGGNHVLHMTDLPPEYFKVADLAATVPASPTQNPAERWMLVILLLYTLQAYGKAIDDNSGHMTFEASNRSRELIIKQGMWDTPFSNGLANSGAPAQPTSKVGPDLLLCHIRLINRQVYEVADYIHSAINGVSYTLCHHEGNRVVEEKYLEEASLEEQLLEVLPDA